jgi:uncharacterized membrane protein YcaP (DUF421 family)
MMFYQGEYGLIRVLVVGSLAYISLVLLLRISGKRTLSKMNAFDLIVTVALGSTLATVLLSRDVPFIEGVFAFALLIFLQYIVTWVSVRSNRFARLVKAEPALVYYQGSFLHKRMKSERVLEDEVLAAMRGQGITSLNSVVAVVLETDGSFSVVSGDDEQPPTTLKGIGDTTG